MMIWKGQMASKWLEILGLYFKVMEALAKRVALAQIPLDARLSC